MSLTVENIGTQHIVLHITVEPQTYLPLFEKKCKETNKTVSIKGFRKGMSPLGLFKKIYGNYILNDVVKDLTDEEVANYLEQNNLHYLATPLMVNQDTEVINYTDPEKNYAASLEFGIKPQIDLSVLYNPEHEFVKYIPKTTDAEVEAQIDILLNNYGTISDLTETDTIQLNDIVYLFIEETDADGNVKESGLSHTTPIIPDMLKDGAEKDILLSLSLNKSAQLNIFNLFDKGRDEVLKQLLNVKENTENLPETYKVTIVQVRRRVSAELNETLYKQVFPEEEIASPEDFKTRITDALNTQYATESTTFLHKQLIKEITQILDPYLPELFLRRLLNERSNQAYAEDEKWNEVKTYFMSEFKWQLIQEELVKQFNVNVDEKEVDQAIIYNVYREIKNAYNVDLPYNMILNYAQNDLQDRDKRARAYQGLLEYHGINALIPNLPIKEQPVTFEEFQKIREDFTRIDEEALRTEEA